MIVQCPSCAARFRLDPQKLGGKRVTLRCARCRNQFKVELTATVNEGSSAPQTRVMVAHSDPDLCGTIRAILENAGMVVSVGHSGDEVLQAMEATPPHVAVVDVALQGLYAFEVVEKVRRLPGLEQVKIILLSSVYNKNAYKRAPSSLYGADDYVEKHHLPDHLALKINRLTATLQPESSSDAESDEKPDFAALAAAEGQETEFIKAVNDKIISAEDREVGAGEIPDLERAQRLARIIVSDIALYCQERIDEGIRTGNWAQLLSSEIREARKLFLERFPQPEIQQRKLLESAFIDLFERRSRELQAQ
ncbi:MAG: hypothetical protein C0614_12485 [Desulfuromonas sp.]|nr:MAG: hypothetical protein C0614_12485 [Desulfuromonas sp.]